MTTPTLTANDQRIMAMAWHCFHELPRVDYQKLADMAGYATAASATTAWHNVKKKLLSGAPPAAGAAGSAAGAPATPKGTGKGKKRAATTPATDGTTKKRGRKSKSEMTAVPTTETTATDLDDDDETKVEVKNEEGDAEEVVDGETEQKAENEE